jgi:hypothetical protein
MVFVSTTYIFVAGFPAIVTMASGLKFSPSITISVYPEVGPLSGLTLEIMGIRAGNVSGSTLGS